MAELNAIFWEIPTDGATLDRTPANCGLWFETETDRERRYAIKEFYAEVRPAVDSLIGKKLTRRQREIVLLYYYHGKTQEDIAAILDVSQSTVSRHLFGTVRDGKKVGGALTKLRKAIEREPGPEINNALHALQDRLATAV
jgi:hypothetical protein